MIWNTFCFIFASCFIVQTLGEIFRGKRSSLTGTIFILMSVIVIACSFMSKNVDVDKEKITYDVGCEPESKSKTSNLFFITCTNSEIVTIDSDTYQYYKNITDVEPTKEMKFKEKLQEVRNVIGYDLIIFTPFLILVVTSLLCFVYFKKES